MSREQETAATTVPRSTAEEARASAPTRARPEVVSQGEPGSQTARPVATVHPVEMGPLHKPQTKDPEMPQSGRGKHGYLDLGPPQRNSKQIKGPQFTYALLED